MVVSSTDNKRVKHVKKLHDKKYRTENGEFIIETVHLVEEAYKAGLLKEIFMVENTSISFDVPTTYVTNSIMKSMSSLESPSEVLGICQMKSDFLKGNRLLLLDHLQDPGNLGTIIRSCVAFNIDTIILSDKCVDLYNDKVIRASEGMLFHISIIRKNLEEFIPMLQNDGYQIIGTSVTKAKSVKDISLKDKYALIIGNEGSGIRNEILDLCEDKIYIPIDSKCESLNASVAASILLYEFYKEK